jgi:ketosteroid isomerase-like protein
VTTEEVGKRLVELCSAGKNLQAIDELYSDQIVSIEAQGDEQMPRTMNGKEAIIGKNQWWIDNHEVHEMSVKGPFPHDDRFTVLFSMDVTPKDGPMKGRQFTMEEVALYRVKDGKIVQEEFFYSM